MVRFQRSDASSSFRTHNGGAVITTFPFLLPRPRPYSPLAGLTPLHLSITCGLCPEVSLIILFAMPEAVEIPTRRGRLPLYTLCGISLSTVIFRGLLAAHHSITLNQLRKALQILSLDPSMGGHKEATEEVKKLIEAKLAGATHEEILGDSFTAEEEQEYSDDDIEFIGTISSCATNGSTPDKDQNQASMTSRPLLTHQANPLVQANTPVENVVKKPHVPQKSTTPQELPAPRKSPAPSLVAVTNKSHVPTKSPTLQESPAPEKLSAPSAMLGARKSPAKLPLQAVDQLATLKRQHDQLILEAINKLSEMKVYGIDVNKGICTLGEPEPPTPPSKSCDKIGFVGISAETVAQIKAAQQLTESYKTLKDKNKHLKDLMLKKRQDGKVTITNHAMKWKGAAQVMEKDFTKKFEIEEKKHEDKMRKLQSDTVKEVEKINNELRPKLENMDIFTKQEEECEMLKVRELNL